MDNDGPDLLKLPREHNQAVDALVELLAPVLTHHQGMAAPMREIEFRRAMAVIAGVWKPVNEGPSDA